MAFLTSPGAVDFYGSLSSELRRDPELARMFYEAGPGRTLANLSAILGSPLEHDELSLTMLYSSFGEQFYGSVDRCAIRLQAILL